MHYFVAYVMRFKKIIVYKTPPQIYFGRAWSSDSTTLNSSIFESTRVVPVNGGILL